MRLYEPKPKYPDAPAAQTSWKVKTEKPLPRPGPHGSSDFFELLERRQTRRQFSALTLSQVADLLWLTTRTTSVSNEVPWRQKCPIPTAGRLTSVRTIVVREADGAWLYEPKSHSAGFLRAADKVTNATLEEARAFINTKAGDLLIFAADKNVVEQHYQHPESLVLRESGGLMGTMAIASEALTIGFCPLGTLGVAWASEMLGVCKEVIVPGGAALVGGR